MLCSFHPTWEPGVLATSSRRNLRWRRLVHDLTLLDLGVCTRELPLENMISNNADFTLTWCYRSPGLHRRMRIEV